MLIFIATGFFTNIIWENWQFHLYGGTATSYPQLAITFFGTLVDVCIFILIYWIMVELFKDREWINNMSWRKLFCLAILGLVAAILNEKIALSLNAWSYLSAMPVVPILHIGLSPLLQLILLPIFSVFVTKLIFKKGSRVS